VTPNSTVTTWAALAGNNATASAGAAIFQPGLGMYFNGSTAFTIPLSITGTNWTVIVDFTPGLASNSPLQSTGNWKYGQVVLSSTYNINAGINLQQNGVVWQWSGIAAFKEGNTGEGNTILTSLDGTGLVYQDGFPNIFYPSSGAANVSLSGTAIYLGEEGPGTGGYNFVGWIRRVRVYNSVLSAAQYAAIWQSDAQKYKSVASPELIVDGDSISSEVADNALLKTGLAYYLTGVWDIRSCAWGGKTLENDASDDDAFAVMQDIRHPGPVVMEYLGTNSIYSSPQDSGATAYALLAARCQVRRAAGNRVAVVTMLPRASSAFSYEAQRQSYNSLIRTNWRQFADAIIDFKDLAPSMDAWSANFNAGSPNTLTATGSMNYNTDLIHPTAHGATLIAQAEASVINGMISTPPGVQVSNAPGQIVMSNTSIGSNASYQPVTPGGNVTLANDGSGAFTVRGNTTLSGLIVSNEIGTTMKDWYPFTTSLTTDVLGGQNLSNYQAVTSGTGIGGAAAVFTGSNALVATSSIFASGTSFSFSCWFKATSYSNGPAILSDYNVGQNGLWYLSSNTGGAISFGIGNGSGSVSTAGIATSANAWNFAAGTYNSTTGVITAYINGSSATTTLSGSAWSAPSTPFAIGAFYYGYTLNNSSNTYFFNGSIADVRLFPGVALSASAVNTLWNEGLGNGMVSQDLYLSGTVAAPVNTGTPAAWGMVKTGTTAYKLPLYQ